MAGEAVCKDTGGKKAPEVSFFKSFTLAQITTVYLQRLNEF